jgi:hypothetical protein
MEKIRKAMAAIKISQHDCTPQGYFTDSFRDDVLTVFNSYFAFKKCTLQHLHYHHRYDRRFLRRLPLLPIYYFSAQEQFFCPLSFLVT